MEHHWTSRAFPTRKKLKYTPLSEIPIPARRYIAHQYADDIQHRVFETIMAVRDYKYEKIARDARGIPTRRRPCVIIAIDDVFLHTPRFAPYIYRMYRTYPTQHSFYTELAPHDFGAPLPYMLILYEYLIRNGIRVIFITNQKRSHIRRIKLNLALFDVHEYGLLARKKDIDPKHFKTNCISRISCKNRIIAVLNDQPDVEHPALIKFPALYREDSPKYAYP
jgi:hypothetical protein